MNSPAVPPARWPGFWEYLDAGQRSALFAIGRRRRFRPDEAVIHESEPSSHVLIIESGWVKVSTFNVDGREVILALRGPGDIIGEMEAMLDDPRRSAGIRVLAWEVTALVIPAGEFRRFFDSHPAAWHALYKVLALKLRESDRTAREFGRTGVRQALARLLLELAARHGEPNSDKKIAVTLLSQEEIAACIWSSRDAVAHEFRVFREQGIVSTGRRSFAIRNLKELQRIAQSGEY